MDAKVSRRELERAVAQAEFRGYAAYESIATLLAAARVLLDMKPASSDELVETRCGLWRADERAEPWKGGFGSGWRAAEARLLSKVGE